MNLGVKLLIIGGIIVGFWISLLILTQVTHSSIPYFTLISAGTFIENGKTIEYFQVIPEVTIMPVTGFALLIMGAGYIVWEKIR